MCGADLTQWGCQPITAASSTRFYTITSVEGVNIRLPSRDSRPHPRLALFSVANLASIQPLYLPQASTTHNLPLSPASIPHSHPTCC
jgi:hypothetical protein